MKKMNGVSNVIQKIIDDKSNMYRYISEITGVKIISARSKMELNRYTAQELIAITETFGWKMCLLSENGEQICMSAEEICSPDMIKRINKTKCYLANHKLNNEFEKRIRQGVFDADKIRKMMKILEEE